MWKSLLLALSVLFSGVALADYHGDDYDKPDEYRICKIKAEVTIEVVYLSEEVAKKTCRSIHEVFKRGCSVRYLGYGRGYGAFYSNEWIFEGRGRNWKRARQSAFNKYEVFADKFGWGKRFPHVVSFSKCSG